MNEIMDDLQVLRSRFKELTYKLSFLDVDSEEWWVVVKERNECYNCFIMAIKDREAVQTGEVSSEESEEED